MSILHFLPQIFQELWSHKLRAALAIFCITFGSYMVVMLLALGDGFTKAGMQNILADLAENSFVIYGGRRLKPYQGYPQGKTNPIAFNDLIELPKIFSDIVGVSPRLNTNTDISYEGKAYNKNVDGVGPEFAIVRKIKIEAPGRFINRLDIENNSHVVVIGGKIKELLFGKKDPFGQKMLINRVSFMVIGVIDTSNTHDKHFKDYIFISYRSYTTLFGEKDFDGVWLLAKPDSDPVRLEQSLRGYFARKMVFDKKDREALHIFKSSMLYNILVWFFICTRLFLGGCGILILAVGGIGVANMMFLIVTERTYEIGLRKALGATDRHILWQLLLEALVIITLGGGLGMLLAYLTTAVLGSITLPSWLSPPILSWGAMLITFLALAVTGLMSGYFPARKAASMDPIEAIKR